jgi:uncharacterized protein
MTSIFGTAVRVLAVWLLTAAVAHAAELVPLPPLQARVTDLSSILTAEQRNQLEISLQQFEQERGSQIGVLLLPSTKPESIEEYGMRLAEAWKLGRKGVDDGVIIIVAKDDRRMRFEVGYGLEGALNDATAKRIISETMLPKVKTGDYFGALQAGIGAIRQVIANEALPVPTGPTSGHRGSGPRSAVDGNENLLIVFLAAAALIGMLLRAILGNLLGAGLTAAGAGVAAWLMTASLLTSLMAMGAAFFLALFGVNIAWAMLTRRGGGGSGGGFGGGGGGFGGGGASGRW